MKAIAIFRRYNPRSFLFIFLVTELITGCTGSRSAALAPAATPNATDCPVTQAIWLKPPEDATVSGTPAPGYYYANETQTILASAWWVDQADAPLRATQEGNKIGWFRPQGADLTITGRRIDAAAPPLNADVPCCYTGQFQAAGLMFPTPGCWEITGQSSGQSVTFVVRVEP